MSNKFALVNYGGSFQLDISSATDLEALNLMDEVFWMATSAPTYSLNCSKEFTILLDSNKNGRILSSDLRHAAEFLLKNLKNYSVIDKRSRSISLDDLSHSEEAQKMKEAVSEILTNLDKSQQDRLSLDDIRNITDIYQNGLSNGDGIIPPEHITDPELRHFAEDICLCLGADQDINGTKGVGAQKLTTFLQSAEDYLSWKDSKDYNPEILPLHEKTADAFQVFNDLRHKINDYFKACHLSRFTQLLDQKTQSTECLAANTHNAQAIVEYLEEAPVAPINHDIKLHFNKQINPIYQKKVDALCSTVLNELLVSPVQSLIEEDWLKVSNTFAPYEEWFGSRKGCEVKALEDSKLQHYLNSSLPAKLQELIDEDLLLGKKLQVKNELEKLLILQHEFLDFTNNFVSFPHLYNPEKRAIFEIGHLVIDGRIFNFNIPVQDIKTHSKLAQKSGIYIMYLEITGAKDEKIFHICTPVTSRRLGLLSVNKRGVLFDLQGKEWDAKVVQVLNNPVSLTEAVIAPFKKMSQLIINAVDKISNHTEKHFENKINTTGQDIQKNLTSATNKSLPTKKADASNTARDLMLTGSVTFAALGSSFAYISSTFSSMNWEHRMATFSIGLLIIILPVILVAAIKLYRRNISSILEASGWSINAHMRLTPKLANILAPRPDSPGRVFRKKRDLLGTFSNKFKFRIKKK
jgi:hypothetical protein